MEQSSNKQETREVRNARYGLRKDVMILRQVIYKELMANKQKTAKNARDLVLTEDDKKLIDNEVSYFFTEIPQAALDNFFLEFPLEDKTIKPKTKVEGKDLESEGIY